MYLSTVGDTERAWRRIVRRTRQRCVRAILTATLAVVPAFGLVACDGILDVDLPGVVDESELDDPALAALLVNSVIADFECAYTNYTGASSAQSDEWLQIGRAHV